jgi:Ser/Thr protein kinase RdoA (MazF antagonist)
MIEPLQVARAGWGVGQAAEPLGAGHINDTYLVTDGVDRWVLQRINDRVFSDPALLMRNLGRVVDHVSTRAPGFVPRLLPCRDGANVFVDEEGGSWRITEYVSGTESHRHLDGVEQAVSAARAFARYQNLLADLPGPRLDDPLPGFMRLDGYLAALDAVTERAAGVIGEDDVLGFVEGRRYLAQELKDPGRSGGYIHGDCKINNLLFRESSAEVVCVVDLDTTMHGHWAWDFGDLARSGAVTDDGSLSLDLFGALVEGFAGEKEAALAADELVLAPRYVCFMLGVRFLTDHLDGDRYFKIQTRGDNLRRARAQFRLLEEMEAQEAEMAEVAARRRQASPPGRTS